MQWPQCGYHTSSISWVLELARTTHSWGPMALTEWGPLGPGPCSVSHKPSSRFQGPGKPENHWLLQKHALGTPCGLGLEKGHWDTHTKDEHDPQFHHPQSTMILASNIVLEYTNLLPFHREQVPSWPENTWIQRHYQPTNGRDNSKCDECLLNLLQWEILLRMMGYLHSEQDRILRDVSDNVSFVVINFLI